MTVDMLAATFFWPEAVVLGSDQRPPEISDSDRDPEGLPGGLESGEGLWAALRRLFARSAWGKDSAVPV